MHSERDFFTWFFYFVRCFFTHEHNFTIGKEQTQFLGNTSGRAQKFDIISTYRCYIGCL